MFSKVSLCLLLATAASCCVPAAAQTIYRCGESYSQQPCPGGRQVQADDPRTASQRAQTSEAVRRDAHAADAMEKARLKEEAKAAQAVVPQPKPEALEQPDGQAATPGVAKKPAYFTAVSPAKKGDKPGKKKKKAKKKPSA